MKVRADDPGADCLMIAFNGEIVGYIEEADTEAGYIIQIDYDWPTQTFRGRARKDGKVAVLGNTEYDGRDALLANFNKHRAECGLPPFEDNA